MFRIVDGRESFYQWDLDRQIIVEDPTITEVHFCNRTDDCSLVVEVVNRLANVPNVILQRSFDVRVFGYDGKATRYDEVFKVKARSKPSDYVYTEVEIKRYEDLEKHLDERIDEIAKNGIKADLEGYATEEYVDNAIANINIPEASTAERDTYYIDITALEWVEDFVDYALLSEDMVEAVGKIKANIPVNIYIKDNESKQWRLTQYYLQGDDVIIYRVMAWTDIGQEATPQRYRLYYVDDLSAWIVEADNATTQTYVIADKKYVDNAIANIDIPEADPVDLTNYYTKEETNTAIQNALNAIGVAERGSY